MNLKDNGKSSKSILFLRNCHLSEIWKKLWTGILKPKLHFLKKKQKEFPDAFILSSLENYYRQNNQASIAVVTADEDFRNACLSRRYYIDYYSNLGEYVDALKSSLTEDDRETEPIDLTRPVVTEDLTALKEILGRGSHATPVEVDRVLMLLRSRGENYHYFFSRSSDPIWLSYLEQDGYFKNPPNSVVLSDGSVQYPFWRELEYLKNVSQNAPEEIIREEIIRIVLKLPAVDNPRVYNYILDIALSLDGEQSVRLKPKMLEYAKLEYQLLAHRYQELLAHWTAENQTQAALELAEILIQFHPNPQDQENQNAQSSS